MQMKLDNVTAVTCINKLGGAHSQALCQLALMIWDWCIQRDVFLVAEHLPGKDNITSHDQQRTVRLDAEPPSLPADTTADGSSIDRPDYISINKATAEFLSWKPDPEAIVTDAFNQRTRGFANPPWCLYVE